MKILNHGDETKETGHEGEHAGEHGKEGEVVHGEKKEDPLKDVVVDPDSGHILDGKSGQEIDPLTGEVVDDGSYIDEGTGLAIDPYQGRLYDPVTDTSLKIKGSSLEPPKGRIWLLSCAALRCRARHVIGAGVFCSSPFCEGPRDVDLLRHGQGACAASTGASGGSHLGSQLHDVKLGQPGQVLGARAGRLFFPQGLMGQGLEIVQECWVREEREQLLTTEHQEHTTPRVVRARHSWSPGEGAEGDRCQRVAPPTPSAKTPRVVGHWHSLGLAGHHIDWPVIPPEERWQRLLGLYQREEGATQALEEEDDWQQLKQRLQELTELMECSARWRFAADSAQQVEGRLRALEAENLELTRKLQASSSASGSEAGRAERGVLISAMLGTVLRCWALLGAVSAVHVAFIAPPASHYAPMLPIAHGLLDDGHQVSFVGFDETVQKIKKLVPKAGLVGIGTSPFDREKMAPMQEFIQSVEYSKAQVFTSMAAPMLGNMMGVLDIPLVGIGWAAPSFLTVQIDLPWATEPNVGSIHSRQEIYENPRLLVENTLVRILGFLALRLGSTVNMWYRFQLGHPRPLEVWEFDSVLQHPLLLTSLPELSAGLPSLLGPYTFPVGILDHLALEGSGMMKSDDQEKIMTWLDAQLAQKTKVLYVAFGSEVRVGKAHASLLVDAFQLGNFTVLWATKVAPTVPVPEQVLVTKFAPQRAVLAHPAVFGFVSHGGMNSVNEALAFGKPMAIMPFFADQMMVAAVHRDLGVAVLVNKNEATPQSLAESWAIADQVVFLIFPNWFNPRTWGNP
eukprot:g19494.t1